MNRLFVVIGSIVLALSSCSETIRHRAYTVEIKQMQFQPATLTVEKGDTVVFVNHDLVVHDVTEASTGAWTSSPLPVDSSWRFVVTGTADYYCSIHKVMKGKLVMQ